MTSNMPLPVKNACAFLSSRLSHGFSLALFGSRAANAGRKGSDWDIAIVGPAPVPWVEFSVMKLDAQEKAWPYTIDIVDINRAPRLLHDSIVQTMIPLKEIR